MSAELRFDDRVVVVTGAGRGLGREFALLFARRGASVVVNDVGAQSNFDGSGSDPSRAESVVAEIAAAGGVAVADANSVRSVAGARSIVSTALDRFGRVDVVVNNAGFLGSERKVPETTEDDFASLISVHLLGAAFVCQAAWPTMEEQRYGRIVNITSGGMFGHGSEIAYSAAKAGQYGLTRALAAAGMASGIQVNGVMPFAHTPMTVHAMSQGDSPISGEGRDWLGTWLREVATPEIAAPIVGWLGHEKCTVTGELFSAGAGRVARAVLADTPGVIDSALTLESVSERFGEIMSDTRFEIHPDAPARAAYHHRLVQEAQQADERSKAE